VRQQGGGLERTVTYSWTKFTPATIQQALRTIGELVPKEERRAEAPSTMSITLEHEEWEHDDADEFFADYLRCRAASLDAFPSSVIGTYRLIVHFKVGMTCIDGHWVDEPHTLLIVRAPTRREVLKVGRIFSDAAESAAVAKPEFEQANDDVSGSDAAWEKSIKIFIGHGQEEAWRELSDCLEKQHGFSTDAFEFGANAGHATRSILERLVVTSSFALLVMTAENEDSEGKLHARENVIHEAGLFQGAFGYDRAIVLLEDGCEEFSNIHGIQQIRFPRGHIKGVVGEVLATLRREFGQSD